MSSIALICEGVSEIKILSYIINRYMSDDVVVNAIQPSLKTAHGQEKQDEEGGWLQVLNHCTDEVVKDVMAANEYLVIQIDTDACIQTNYDVDIYDKDHKKVSDNILYERVCTRLKQNISEDTWSKYSDRILFAICFNETECWLLPLYYENDAKKRCATSNSIYILNQKLQKDGFGIPEKAKNSPEAVNVYQQILKKMKRKDIPRIAQYNYGFQKFVEQLETIKDDIEEESL
ncbi:MAG: hypothetical protein IJ841_01280 [Prevotella sp.]|nr:hypothetical protein [Prevotella sp.]